MRSQAPLRVRVIGVPEGWPTIPGKLGRLEWHDGTELAIYTDRPRLFTRLWAVPGICCWQVGHRRAEGSSRLQPFRWWRR